MTVKVDADYDDAKSYESGNLITVVDGHLLIKDHGGTVVAAIAPGKWTSAEVVKGS